MFLKAGFVAAKHSKTILQSSGYCQIELCSCYQKQKVQFKLRHDMILANKEATQYLVTAQDCDLLIWRISLVRFCSVKQSFFVSQESIIHFFFIAITLCLHLDLECSVKTPAHVSTNKPVAASLMSVAEL